MRAHKTSFKIMLISTGAGLLLCFSVFGSSYAQESGVRHAIQADTAFYVDGILNKLETSSERTLADYTKNQLEVVSIAEIHSNHFDGSCYRIFSRRNDATTYIYEEIPITREELIDKNKLDELKALIKNGWQYVDMAANDLGNSFLLLFKRDYALPTDLNLPDGDASVMFEVHKLANLQNLTADSLETLEDYFEKQAEEQRLPVGFAEYDSGYVIQFADDRAFSAQGLHDDSSGWKIHVEITGENNQDLAKLINELEAPTDPNKQYIFLKAARLDKSFRADETVLLFATNKR